MATIPLEVELKIARGSVEKISKDINKRISVDAGAGGKAKGGVSGGGGGSLFGLAAAFTTGGVAITALNQMVDLGGKTLDFMKGIFTSMVQSSSLLQGVLKIFEVAMILFWKPFGDFLGSLLRPFVRTFFLFTKNWNKWFQAFFQSEVFNNILSGIEGMLEAIKAFTGFGGDVGDPKKLFEDNLQKVADSIVDVSVRVSEIIINGFFDLLEAVARDPGPYIDLVISTFAIILTAIGNIASKIQILFLRRMLEFITNMVSGFSEVTFNEWIPALVKFGLDFSRALGNWILDFVGSVSEFPLMLFNAFTRWLNDIVTLVQDIPNFFRSRLLTKISEGLAAVRDLGRRLVDTIISAISRALSGLDDLLKLALGGGGIGSSVPRFMANGGIVTKPTLAMVGEAGPEAVVPLGRGGGGFGGNITVNINANMRSDADLAELANRLANLTKTRLGNRRNF